jgi:hypothetical protein
MSASAVAEPDRHDHRRDVRQASDGADAGEAADADDADADGSTAGKNPGTGPEPPEMSDPRDTMGGAG